MKNQDSSGILQNANLAVSVHNTLSKEKIENIKKLTSELEDLHQRRRNSTGRSIDSQNSPNGKTTQRAPANDTLNLFEKITQCQYAMGRREAID